MSCICKIVFYIKLCANVGEAREVRFIQGGALHSLPTPLKKDRRNGILMVCDYSKNKLKVFKKRARPIKADCQAVFLLNSIHLCTLNMF